MRILIFAACGMLAACDAAQAPAPDNSDAPPASVPAAMPKISPPGEAEFRAAWSAACGADAGDIGSAVCKAQALGADGFACDFALGDDEYRRYAADLARDGDSWVLADPAAACKAADPE